MKHDTKKRLTLVQVIVRNLVLILATLIVTVGAVLLAAQTDIEPSRTQILSAFDSGVLDTAHERELELVPGFIVRTVDTFSTCTILSLTQSPASEVFGIGPWSSASYSCNSVYLALTGDEGQQSWYRYWHGAAAAIKIALNFMSFNSLQILVSIGLALFVMLTAIRVWRYSPTLSVGLLVIVVMASDLLWHGMSVGLGISSLTGLIGAFAILVAFEKCSSFAWGVVASAGVAYAVVSDMFLPMAFAVLSAVLAMTPLLTNRDLPPRRQAMRGGLVVTVWIGGYLLGLLSRYAWIGVAGPGWDSLRGIATNASGFMSATVQEPFIMVLYQVMNSWFGVGFMQIGLAIATGVLGWSLARGGIRAFRSQTSLLTLMPFLATLVWLLVWGGHTAHLFVNVLLAISLFSLLFVSEFARSRVEFSHDSGPRNTVLDPISTR